MSSPLPVGRGVGGWNCNSEPVIYPGWWAHKNIGVRGDVDTIDGTRTMAPAVVKVGAEFWLYYLAERKMPQGTQTKILRAVSQVSDPTAFVPKGIAFEFPLGFPVTPKVGESPETYCASGPYHTSVLPWLKPDGSGPGINPTTGGYYPWYMFFASVGSNTGIARSVDGGRTFQMVPGKNPLFPFEVIKVGEAFRRAPVLSKSKPYDYGGCGSASAVRDVDGKFHLFYTSMASGSLGLDDIGASASEVGHPDGAITDIGIGYAESLDGVSFTRRTSQSLGVISSASRGSGRIVDPRRRDDPNGLMEYIVSRPMVFKDGDVWRMLVSSHSKTYRARSLHSANLVDWTWDASPSDGFLGLGPAGSFDEYAVAYPCALRDGDTYHVWYTGNGYGHVSAGITGIGYATASAIPD